MSPTVYISVYFSLQNNCDTARKQHKIYESVCDSHWVQAYSCMNPWGRCYQWQDTQLRGNVFLHCDKCHWRKKNSNSYRKYEEISFGPALNILLLWKYISPKSTKHPEVQYKENLEWPQLMKTKSPFYLQKILKSEEDCRAAIMSVSLMLVNWSKLKWVPLWTYCNLVNNNGIPWNDHSNCVSPQFLQPWRYKLERRSDDTWWVKRFHMDCG